MDKQLLKELHLVLYSAAADILTHPIEATINIVAGNKFLHINSVKYFITLLILV